MKRTDAPEGASVLLYVNNGSTLNSLCCLVGYGILETPQEEGMTCSAAAIRYAETRGA